MQTASYAPTLKVERQNSWTLKMLTKEDSGSQKDYVSIKRGAFGLEIR
jgi:hypothetical protein